MLAVCSILDKDNRWWRFLEIADPSGDIYVAQLTQNCQEYVNTISTLFPPSRLQSTRIVIIGHGHANLITEYAKHSSAQWPIYADSSKALYHLLDMTRTLQLGSKAPEYASGVSTFRLAARSLWQELTAGRNMFHGGDYYQVGGDFLCEDGHVKWCHRMQNTRDHASSQQIQQLLGLEQ